MGNRRVAIRENFYGNKVENTVLMDVVFFRNNIFDNFKMLFSSYKNES